MAVGSPDTSCLIHLERIGRLDLLRALYADLRIPPAVRDECGRVPDGIEGVPASSPALIRLLRRTVDAGEAEVIALATEIDDAHIVLDDRTARQEAHELGLNVVGTVGLVLRAKRDGHIPAARPLLDALRGTGFWMSGALYQRALDRSGEAS